MEMVVNEEDDLIEQCERDGVSERPLQDGVVLPSYHLIKVMMLKMMVTITNMIMVLILMMVIREIIRAGTLM